MAKKPHHEHPTDTPNHQPGHENNPHGEQSSPWNMVTPESLPSEIGKSEFSQGLSMKQPLDSL
ncbi:MAG: hypothetical protein Q4G29_01215 [Pseudoscardovia radai]|nr:hypothetical protein [Pseudoscardovia radai]